MSDSNTAMNLAGGQNAWSSTRMATAYQEARAVLNAQQARKQHMDDKALRTARLATAVATIAISLIGGFRVQVRQPFGVIGGFLLVTAFGFAITSYTTSPLYLGPNEQYLDRLVRNSFTEEMVVGEASDTDLWEHSLCLIMGDWVSKNYRILAVGKRRLIASEIALFVGLTTLMMGVVL